MYVYTRIMTHQHLISQKLNISSYDIIYWNISWSYLIFFTFWRNLFPLWLSSSKIICTLKGDHGLSLNNSNFAQWYITLLNSFITKVWKIMFSFLIKLMIPTTKKTNVHLNQKSIINFNDNITFNFQIMNNVTSCHTLVCIIVNSYPWSPFSVLAVTVKILFVRLFTSRTLFLQNRRCTFSMSEALWKPQTLQA